MSASCCHIWSDVFFRTKETGLFSLALFLQQTGATTYAEWENMMIMMMGTHHWLRAVGTSIRNRRGRKSNDICVNMWDCVTTTFPNNHYHQLSSKYKSFFLLTLPSPSFRKHSFTEQLQWRVEKAVVNTQRKYMTDVMLQSLHEKRLSHSHSRCLSDCWGCLQGERDSSPRRLNK